MREHDGSGRAPRKPSGKGRRAPVANEEGLRRLGEQMKGRGMPDEAVAALGAGAAAVGTAGAATTMAAADGGGSGAGSPPAGADGPPVEVSGGGRKGRQHSTPRSRRSRRWRRGLVIALVLVLVVAGGAAAYGYQLTHGFHRQEVRGLSTSLTTGQEGGTENILMVGSTSRCALTVQNPAYGLCSEGVNGVNSDVIMILHADPAHHRLALLSIPRDLFIPNARSTGANKVDAGLFQGLSQVVAAVEEDFGIPIQHAVSLNFDQFANIVDALGGINMSFPVSVYDAESGLNVQAAACVHLNGTQALEVVRARHLQYDQGTTSEYAAYWPQENQSDLARIRRDHEFLRVLGSTVAKQGLGDPITDINLINSVKSDLTFDQSWSVTDMAHLVVDFHAVSVNSVPQLTLPVSVVLDPDGAGGSYQYQGGTYGDVEFPADSQDQATIDQVLGISASTDSMTGATLPAPSTVTVSVMNGSGAYNQATDTADALTALGFKTVGVGDTPPVGDVSETVVYYGSRSPAVVGAAEAVERSMTGAVIMAYDPSQVADGAQVTVVTGTDFAVNAPTPATSPTSSSATVGSSVAPTTTVAAPTTTTTTTTPASGTAAIQTPSASSTALAAWDPRACPAGATPTAPVPNRV
jgi:LCP family protein required for cell wall assembly